LDKAPGKGCIWVFAHREIHKAIDVEDSLQLLASGATKNGLHKQNRQQGDG